MKALLFTLLPLILTSCSSSRIYESENGVAVRSSSLRMDQLRGAHEGRDEEQMEFSRNIIRTAGPAYTKYGQNYTGAVKIYKWKGRDKKVKFVALREIQLDRGMMGYQGPNPPTNFYGSDYEEIMIYSFSPEVQKMLAEEGIL